MNKILFLILILTFQSVSAYSLPDDIVLDKSHGGDGSAWGISHCDSCHLLNFIHADANPKVKTLTRDKGYSTCSGCHGSNGTGQKRVCVSCHNQSDLPYASHQSGSYQHNFIADNTDIPLTDMDCLTCHRNSNMDGAWDINVDLSRFNKLDQPYRFESDFCLACHNRDRQQSGYEIPGKDYRDPLVAMPDNFSAIDKHGLSVGSGQRTYAGLRPGYRYGMVLECSECHAMHGTENEKLIISNAYHGASRLAMAIKQQDIAINTQGGQYAQFCVICHQMENLVEEGVLDTGNGLYGVHQADGPCIECHRHGMAVQTGL